MDKDQEQQANSDKLAQNTRWWDKQFNDYIAHGGKKPGTHPDPNHLWNKDPEAYMNMKQGNAEQAEAEA